VVSNLPMPSPKATCKCLGFRVPAL
jgi:hypothetical protein